MERLNLLLLLLEEMQMMNQVVRVGNGFGGLE